MRLNQFVSLFFQNFLLYFVIFFIVTAIYVIFLKRYIFHILDPFFYLNLVSSSFATTTVLFLIFFNKVNTTYAINYISTLLVFWFTFICFAKKIPKKYLLEKSTKSWCLNDNFFLPGNFFVIFFLFSLLNISCQLFIYLKCGIPLFMNSRLEVSINGGSVIGLLSRLQVLFATVSNFMVFYIVFFCSGQKRFCGKIYLGISFLFSFLSGSKGSFLSYIFLFSSFVYFTQCYNKRGREFLTNKKIYFLIVPILLITFCIIGIQGKLGFFSVLQHLFLRFAAYGDGYIYSYPNGVIEHITKQNVGEVLFGDFLHTFRLTNSERKIGFGFELSDLVYDVQGSTTGPNPRFNLVGYAYFGFFGSIVVSFLCGLLLAIFRNLFIKSVHFGSICQVFVYFIYSIGSSIETDLPAVIASCTTNLFLQIPIIFFIIFIVENARPKQCKIDFV